MSEGSLSILAKVSQEKFAKQEKKCEENNEIVEAQLSILNEYAQSYNGFENIENSIAEVDSKIVSIDKEIDVAQKFMNQLLLDRIEYQKQSECSEMMKLIMDSTIQNFHDAMKSSVENSKPNVSIFTVIELENNFAQLIAKLKDQNMYPISQEDDAKQNQKVKDHNTKILSFLKQFVGQQ